MSSPLIQLVDEHDTPLRVGTMDEAQLQGLWHRIARIMLFDESTQRYLVQKIAPNPYYNGGLWNTSAGGHVDENETYLDTVLRELAEKMGVYGMHSPKEVLRYKTTKTSFRAGDTRTYNRHNVTHLALIDGTSLEMQLGDEVEEAAWFTVVELKSMRDSSAKVMTDALEYFVDQYLH